MAENILHDFHEQVPAGVSLIPSSGGVFEISYDGAKIFSKKETGRFPDENEVEEKLESVLSEK